MSECDYPYLAPGGVDCGFGTCENSTGKFICVCDTGFQATGDYHFEPLDCDQHQTTLIVLWLILAVVCGLAGLYALFYLLLFIRTKRRVAKTVFDSSFVVYTSFVLFAFCFMTLGVLKGSLEEFPLLGENVPFTLLYCLGSFCFYLGGFLFTKQLLKFYTLQAKYFGLKLQIIDNLPFRLFMFVNFLISLFPFICLFDQENAVYYQILNYFISGILIGLLALFANRFLGKLLSSIDKTVERFNKPLNESETRLKTLKAKLEFLIQQTKISGVINVIIAWIVAFWPFLTRKASYALAIAWSTAGLVAVGVCRILGNTLLRKKSTSDAGKGQTKTGNKTQVSQLNQKISFSNFGTDEQGQIELEM